MQKRLYACDECNALYNGRPELDECNCGYSGSYHGHNWYHIVAGRGE